SRARCPTPTAGSRRSTRPCPRSPPGSFRFRISVFLKPIRARRVFRGVRERPGPRVPPGAGLTPDPGMGGALNGLFSRSFARVTRYVCLVREHGLSEEHRQVDHVIAFPYRGAFFVHQGPRAVLIEASTLLFLNAGEAYRTSHPYGGGD